MRMDGEQTLRDELMESRTGTHCAELNKRGANKKLILSAICAKEPDLCQDYFPCKGL